jgi:aminoglycoside phosphotransferase (APT) family kinase protein
LIPALRTELPENLLQFLKSAGLAGRDEIPPTFALAGGVSSDIWRVELARGPVCVKRALARLKVAKLWEAPVERNRHEAQWLRVAGDAVPGAAPRVLAEGDGAFAMEYLDPARHPVWKSLLSEGRADSAFAAKVGAVLARIHAATAGREDLARRFSTDAIFRAIRLEPYLSFLGLHELAGRTARTKVCLVHGDVSPKNILVGPHGPVLLDAECAWWGDPSFDLAFCLNHLLLKCVWQPPATARFLAAFDALLEAYLEAVDWEPRAALEQRASALLPGLLLARVDGKSPVEYIGDEAEREVVRRTARELLQRPVDELAGVRSAWERHLGARPTRPA